MSFSPANLKCSPSLLARRALALVVVCLIVVASVTLNHQSQNFFAAPSWWFLAMLSCVLVIPLKANAAKIIQKSLAAYLVAMSVDYSSGIYWHLTTNLQIAAGLPIAGAAILAAWTAPWRTPGGDSSTELEIAIGAAISVVVVLLLAAGILVHSWYGFGAERSLGVLGQLAMAILAAAAAWRLADDAAIRVAVGFAAVAAYSWMAVS